MASYLTDKDAPWVERHMRDRIAAMPRKAKLSLTRACGATAHKLTDDELTDWLVNHSRYTAEQSGRKIVNAAPETLVEVERAAVALDKAHQITSRWMPDTSREMQTRATALRGYLTTAALDAERAS